MAARWLFVGSLIAATSTSAQEFQQLSGLDWMVTQSVIGTDANGQVLRERRETGRNSSRSKLLNDRTSVRETDEHDRKATFDFVPDLDLRQANVARFIEQVRARDPQDAANLEALNGSTDIVAAIDREMRTAGLRANNVADAYAAWWTVAWYAVQGRESFLDTRTAAAVRRQAAEAIVATGKLAGASDMVKQELAEALILQSALIDAMNEKMRDDPNLRRVMSTTVSKGAKRMGLDLTAMTLTPDGFRPRKGSDASKVIYADPGAPPAALAASAPAVSTPAVADTDDDTATYVLIAAAGGAGLAAVFMLGRATGRKA